MIDALTEDAGPARGSALAEGRATERTVEGGDPLAPGAGADGAAAANADGRALATFLTPAGAGAGCSSGINATPIKPKGSSTSVSFFTMDASRHDDPSENLEAARGASGAGTPSGPCGTFDAVMGRPAAGTSVAPEARRTSSAYV